MTEAEIISIIEMRSSGNVICRNVALRPNNLAMLIAMLANTASDMGYIFMGVEIDGDAYKINGISRDFKSEQQAQKALRLLTNPPEVECQSVLVNGKNVFAIKIKSVDSDVFFDIQFDSDNGIDIFMKDLLRACVKLQANIHYRNAREDTRNDYIRDLLSMKKYSVKDQTRRGYSASGLNAGEADIYVEVDGMPFTLIEALNLDSLDKTYLNKHLDKIFGYDTTGHKFNVCLSYVEAKDFASFWDSYCKHVVSYNYPYSLIEAQADADRDFPYSEIRFMMTTHNRSGKLTMLFHIAIRI
jgi:hypothetical protein